MTTESYYLESLEDTELHLDSPLPMELSGGGQNWVASWLEGNLEGEGTSKENSIKDCRQIILTRYRDLEKRIRGSERLKTEDETVWISLCHYIINVSRGRLRPGEEFEANSYTSKDYKGPIFG